MPGGGSVNEVQNLQSKSQKDDENDWVIDDNVLNFMEDKNANF